MGRRGDHGGHHGGAWKVAYADFVTAMMALFIVLWILGSSAENQASIVAYFNNPGIFDKGDGKGYLTEAGVIQLQKSLEQIKAQEAADSAAVIEAALMKLGVMDGGTEVSAERGTLSAYARQLEEAIHANALLREVEGQISIEFTSRGLRIQMEDLNRQPLFALGSPAPTSKGRALLEAIARVLAPLPNPILIEGHTDSRPFAGRNDYSNWELSGDRANAARRVMEEAGLDPTRLVRVIGYADRQLLVPEEPFSDRNRRISITIAYNSARLD